MKINLDLKPGKCGDWEVKQFHVSEEVINLVGWAYEKDPRVEIVKSDIFDYKPKEHFDYAWFDIWPYITGDNYPEMKRLHRKFARHATVKDSWCRAMCQRRWKYEQ